MVRVSLLADEPVLVEGVAAVLAGAGGLSLVAAAAGEEISARPDFLRADIALLDAAWRIPFALIANLKRRAPRLKIVLWVRAISVPAARQAIEAGVHGILQKDAVVEHLILCLRTVARGELWFERSLTQRMLSTKTVSLTRRERQLLALLAQGSSNKDIAAALSISEGTVKYYFSRLFRKVGVADRFSLALCSLNQIAGNAVTEPAPAGGATGDCLRSFVVVESRFGPELKRSEGVP